MLDSEGRFRKDTLLRTRPIYTGPRSYCILTPCQFVVMTGFVPLGVTMDRLHLESFQHVGVTHDQLIQEHSVVLALASTAPGINLETP